MYTSVTAKGRKEGEVDPYQAVRARSEGTPLSGRSGVRMSACGVPATRTCPSRGVNCTPSSRQRRNGPSQRRRLPDAESLPGHGGRGAIPVNFGRVGSGALRDPAELLADGLDHLVEGLG